MIELAREELGQARGGKHLEKESWWWNHEVQHRKEKHLRPGRKAKRMKIWRGTKRRIE